MFKNTYLLQVLFIFPSPNTLPFLKRCEVEKNYYFESPIRL